MVGERQEGGKKGEKELLNVGKRKTKKDVSLHISMFACACVCKCLLVQHGPRHRHRQRHRHRPMACGANSVKIENRMAKMQDALFFYFIFRKRTL